MFESQSKQSASVSDYDSPTIKEGFLLTDIRKPTGPKIQLTLSQTIIFLLHTIADYQEQFLQWQETLANRPGCLWPGSGMPHCRLYVLSRLGKLCSNTISIQKNQESDLKLIQDIGQRLSLPPIFNNCTSVIEKEDERKALQSYATAFQIDTNMMFGKDITNINSQVNNTTLSHTPESTQYDESQILHHLQLCSQLNPHVGEPLILQAQIHIQSQNYSLAIQLATQGVQLLSNWGTNWDKRVSFEGWIAWGRCIVYQAGRREWPKTSGGMESLGAVQDNQRKREKLNEGENFTTVKI